MNDQPKPADAQKLRHSRRTGRGQKPMIWLVGLVLTAFAVVNELQRADDEKRGALWPVFVAILAFLYLWWLSSLLFDLAFVWHRYIRGDAAHKFLRQQVQPQNLQAKGEGPEQPIPF